MQAVGYYESLEVEIEDLLIFEQASSESIEAALKHSHVYRVAPGEIVLAPDVSNNVAYVVLEGTLRVDVVGRESGEHTHVGRGECVGELSVIDGGTTSATVIAVDECMLLALSRETVLALVDRSHAVARNLVCLLSRRLKGSNRLLRDEADSSELLRRQVSFDVLTGLHSRAWLEDTLPRMCNRARHGGEGFAIAMCDLDLFKGINDRFGHVMGDRVLQKAAAVLSGCLRPTDLAARFGGEELVAILCGTDTVADARTAAERIRLAVRNMVVEGLTLGQTPVMTVSIGVAVHHPEELGEQLICRADAALYLAKRGGRDRTEVSSAENTISQ